MSDQGNQLQNNALTERTAKLNSLKMQTLLETVTAQRNDAQNQVANLTADKVVLTKVLNDTVEVSQRNEAIIIQQHQQITDLQAALEEAHEALRQVQSKNESD